MEHNWDLFWPGRLDDLPAHNHYETVGKHEDRIRYLPVHLADSVQAIVFPHGCGLLGKGWRDLLDTLPRSRNCSYLQAMPISRVYFAPWIYSFSRRTETGTGLVTMSNTGERF